jgi:hypothetical protein
MPAREFLLKEQESCGLGPIVTFVTISIYFII